MVKIEIASISPIRGQDCNPPKKNKLKSDQRVRAKPNLFTARLYCLDACFRLQPSTPVVDSWGGSAASAVSSRKASECSANDTAGALAKPEPGKWPAWAFFCVCYLVHTSGPISYLFHQMFQQRHVSLFGLTWHCCHDCSPLHFQFEFIYIYIYKQI